jgi:LysM repeat protein
MLPFLLINIAVSAAVVLGILFWWEGRKEEPGISVTSTAVAGAIVTMEPTTASLLQSTNTPEPDDGPPVHVVRAGETLGSLSQLYDVTLEDLMAANGIDNPDLISVGQQLIIPVGGIPTATPLPASTSAPVVDEPPTPIPTDEPLSQGETVVEITAVIGVGNLTEETVQITNSGGRQVALLDWKLADRDGHFYTFDQVTLFGDGAAIQIHTETGTDGPADLYWGLETPIWETGERVTLLDTEDNIRSTFDVP